MYSLCSGDLCNFIDFRYEHCYIRNMSRIRTIDPHFPRMPSLSRVSREARLFFILLWTLADDSGRLRLDHERLKDLLYPFDHDAQPLFPLWLGELESAKCIELYRIDDAEYLCVRKWRQLQAPIPHPTRSRLPPAPHEFHEIHDESPRIQRGRVSKAILHDDAILDTEDAGDPGAITPERVLADLDIVLRKARRKEALSSADTRCLDFAGRNTGLWGGRAAPVGGKAIKEPKGPLRLPGPAEIAGLAKRSGE